MADWSSSEPEYFDSSFKKRLPIEGQRNILITSALPYVNNVPHLGNIIGSVLSADVFSRYCQMRGYQSLFICGTDEYGTATEMKALKDGASCQEICDKFHRLHKEIYDWFNIDFDYFGRTTTQHQTEICQDIFKNAHNNKYTSTSSLEQLHCETCDKFLADRFVFGICPHCKFTDARGDQCDGCGKLLDGVDLVEPKCHICQNTPKPKKSEHIFLNLDDLAGEVEKYVEKVINAADSHWSSNAIAIVRSWFKQGLEKRCITRDLKWGTPVPLEGFDSKVFYVWFDAPIGYLSMTKTLVGEDWVKWWKNPNQVELYQFLGKDNVAFHGVIFPATQIATGDNYTKVRHVCATEYLNYEDKKFSKSRNTGVFGDTVSTIGIPSDIWRFYLIYMRPENQDTAFCWDDFMLKVNSELLANLGNFILRALSFLFTNFNGEQPEIQLTSAENELIAAIDNELAEFTRNMENVRLREALIKILAISRLGNQYIQSHTPWVLVKGSPEEKQRAQTIIGVAANISILLSTLLYPFMPAVSKQIREECNIKQALKLPSSFMQMIKPGHKISKPSALFTKLEPAKVTEWKLRFGASDEASAVQATPKSNKNQKQNKQKAMSKSSDVIVEREPTNFPAIATAQETIDSLLNSVGQKLDLAKKLFTSNEVEKIETVNAKLRQEVESLKLQLGGNASILNVTGSSTNDDIKNDANVKTTQENDLDSSTQATKNSKEPTKKAPQKDQVKAAPSEKSAKGTPSANVNDEAVDVGRLDLRVGRIIEAKKHPDADALYVEQIDLGEGQPRTVVSGLVRFVPLEQMQNRLVVCCCNLKPAKMRGIESQAMVLCASTPEKVEIMEVPAECQPGDVVLCDGFTRRPDPVLNPKKKVWETVAVDLKVSDDGVAVYKGKPLKIGGSHPMTAPTLRNVPVK
ncbi:tRNA synthetases class I (M) domain-containing protein [Ditylenchus destructor]|nr:tRNA synthetases class I (M) domain-containing protein [Ditylenchus destructor]